MKNVNTVTELWDVLLKQKFAWGVYKELVKVLLSYLNDGKDEI